MDFKMLQNVLYVTVLFIVTNPSLAYKSGAPADVCASMTPEHGVPPQSGVAPYTISTLNNTIVKAGSKITVHIKSIKVPFKGFMLEARDFRNKPIGTFDNVANAKLIDCNNGTQNAITHSSPDDKTSISIPWTAPKDIRNRKVTFWCTIAENGNKFWINQKSAPVTVI